MANPCSLKISYPSLGDLTETLNENLTGLFWIKSWMGMKPKLFISFYLEWTARCESDASAFCPDGTNCAWGPIYSKQEIMIDLSKILPRLSDKCIDLLGAACSPGWPNTKNLWTKLVHGHTPKDVDDCLASALRSISRNPTIMRDCAWSDLDEMVDAIDIVALTGMLQDAVSKLPERYCGCAQAAPTKQDVWVINKAIKSSFNAIQKRDLGN